jgi:hypothetical protein
MHPRIDFAALARRVLASGYTTKALGLRIGLSQPAVSRLANGRTRSVSAEAAVELIHVAGGSITLPPDEGQPGVTA